MNENGLSKEEVMSKIQKLMALAASPNEAEAKLAMEKSAFLMEKYSITLGECKTAEDVVSGIIRENILGRTKRTVMWEASLGTGIAETFDCRALGTRDKTNHWQLAFIGTKADVEMTIYFYKYLRRCVGRTADIQANGNGKSYKNTFSHAMVGRILERLERLYKKRQEIKTSDSLALVPVKKEATDNYVKQEFPNIRTTRAKVSNDRSAWARGEAAGDKVALNRSIKGNTNARLAA